MRNDLFKYARTGTRVQQENEKGPPTRTAKQRGLIDGLRTARQGGSPEAPPDGLA
ncbi:MAG TPA: hypothetical protein VEL76_34520 [Gemmataceae bacterium]|nr:hypothetical protein [Gemmataceae bacterium]